MIRRCFYALPWLFIFLGTIVFWAYVGSAVYSLTRPVNPVSVSK